MEWKGWEWYYQRKRELEKIASPVGTPEQVEAWKELVALNKLANAQRYKEAIERTKRDLKRYGKVYKPIARRNLKLYERQWGRDYREIIERKKRIVNPKHTMLKRAKQNLKSPVPVRTAAVTSVKPTPAKPKAKRFDFKKVAFLALGAFVVLKILKR